MGACDDGEGLKGRIRPLEGVLFKMIRSMFLNEGVKKAFPRYLEILKGARKPRFQEAKADGTLDGKIEKAWEILRRCELCGRACGVDRTRGDIGVCEAGSGPRVFGADTHMGEEDELIPSATLFFAGCTMRCAFCQNAPPSIDPEAGAAWSEDRIARWIEEKWQEGCRNVNFVGGEPTPYLYNILRSLRLCEAGMPVVWNSNSFYSEKTAEILKGIVDVYLLDFKFFEDFCAMMLSSAPGYPGAARRNLIEAAKDAELLVRLLVIPNHTECDAKPILRWIRDELGEWTRVNIMGQYRPLWRADMYPDISGKLSREEYGEVVEYAEEIGLKNFIVQEQFL